MPSAFEVAIVACGYMTHKALRARDDLSEHGIDAAVIDLFRVKPLDARGLAATLKQFGAVLTVEEQMLEGGMGSAVLEALADTGTQLPLRRLGMRDGFDVVNGNRDELHAIYGIDTVDIVDAARQLAGDKG